MPAPPMYPSTRPIGWWLRNPRYVLFQARELGGVLTALYGLLLLYQLREFRAGEPAYAALQSMLLSPPMVLVHLVLLAFVVVHAVTWFALIGKAQPIQFTRRPLPWQRVFGVNVGLWLIVSLVVLFLFFGGL